MLELLKKLWKTLFLAPKKLFSRYSNVFNFPPSCPTFWRFKTHVENEIIMTSWNDLHKWPTVISGITQKTFFKKSNKNSQFSSYSENYHLTKFPGAKFQKILSLFKFWGITAPRWGGGGLLGPNSPQKWSKLNILIFFNHFAKLWGTELDWKQNWEQQTLNWEQHWNCH